VRGGQFPGHVSERKKKENQGALTTEVLPRRKDPYRHRKRTSFAGKVTREGRGGKLSKRERMFFSQKKKTAPRKKGKKPWTCDGKANGSKKQGQGTLRKKKKKKGGTML